MQGCYARHLLAMGTPFQEMSINYPIAIINDDAGKNGGNDLPKIYGKIYPLKKSRRIITNKQALKDLSSNDLALVVQYPKTFSENIQKVKRHQASTLTINEAGATVVSSTMNLS